MRKMYQSFVPAIIVLLALVMSAFWIMPVHADDGTPPSTAPAVTQPQGGSSTTDQSTTKATTDSSPAPSGGDAPVVNPPSTAPTVSQPQGGSTTTDASPAPSNGNAPVVNPPATDQPAPAITTKPVVHQATPAGKVKPAAGNAGLLAQVPSGTQVVVTNSSGDVVPLGSQEAAQTIATGDDPTWCPTGVNPGGAGCSSAGSFSALLASMTNKTVAGTIWIESTVTDTSPITLNSTTMGTSTVNYALTLKGGWNGSSGALAAITGSSTFSVPLTITWNSDVTLSNITITGLTGSSSTALTITTPKSVTLTGVNVGSAAKPNSGSGAKINNTSSTTASAVTVSSSTFSYNTGSGDGLDINSNGAITLNSVTANNNGLHAAVLDNTTATSAQPVSITGTTLSNNYYGLDVESKGAITINSLTATSNLGGWGAYLRNYLATTPQAVTLTGTNTFNGNWGGLYILSKGAITSNGIQASNNVGISGGSSGVYVDNSTAATPQPVTLAGINTFNNNSWGNTVYSKGSITVNQVTADGNANGEGLWLDNCNWNSTSNTCQITGAVGGVTLTGSNQFENNSNGSGLVIYSVGAISANQLTAISNQFDGAYLDNCLYDTTNNWCTLPTGQPVTLTGTNTFTSNYYHGLYVTSLGQITTNNLNASGNGTSNSYGSGAWLEGGNLNSKNQFFGGVTLLGSNNFTNNYYDGLDVDAMGAITANNITATGNGLSVPTADQYRSGVGAWLSTFSNLGNVTLTGTNMFAGNHSSEIWTGTNPYNNTWGGLTIMSFGAIQVNNVTSNGDLTAAGAYLDNCELDQSGNCQIFGVAPITLTGTNTFNNNFLDGLDAYSYSNITASGLTASGNGASSTSGTGVSLNNDYTIINASNKTVNSVGVVILTGTNQFNTNASDGLDVYSYGAITLYSITANGNGTAKVDPTANFPEGYGVYIQNNYNTALPQVVSLLGTNQFNNNWLSGLDVFSYGTITLNSATATSNGQGKYGGYGFGASLNNCLSSGSACATVTAMPVTVIGSNVFNGNYDSGLWVTSKGAITVSNITADNNTSGNGAYLENDYTGATPALTLIGALQFNGNGDNGLGVYTKSAITLTDVDAIGNTGDGAYLNNTAGTVAAAVTLTNTNVFSQNGNFGLEIHTNGAITANNLVNNSNGGKGALLDNCGYNGTVCTKSTIAAVTLTGSNQFKFNGQAGLMVRTNGAITLSNITANNNSGGSGVFLDNCGFNDGTSACTSSIVSAVTLNGINTFNKNNSAGLSIFTNGPVTANNLSSTNNGYGDSATGYGVDIENWTATTAQPVTLTGSNFISYNNLTGLWLITNGVVTINNLSANSNGDLGAYILNCGYSTLAICTSAGIKTPQNVTFTGYVNLESNFHTGMLVRSYGAISLNNVNANNNGQSKVWGDGVYLDNCEFGDLTAGKCDTTLPRAITLTGNNSFDNNYTYGLKVNSLGAISVNNVNADNNGNTNGYDGVFLENDFPGAVGAVSVNNTATYQPDFSSNGGYGLYILSRGTITVMDLNAQSNGADGVYLDNTSNTTGTAAVNLGTARANWSNWLSYNYNSGLEVLSNGLVTLSSLNAENNGHYNSATHNSSGYGVWVNNSTSSLSQGVTLNGTWNGFKNNYLSGLEIYTTGIVTTNQLDADNNGYNTAGETTVYGYGVLIDNCAYNHSTSQCTILTPKTITLNGYNNYNNNYSGGLYVYSNGAITSNTVNSNNNITGSGASFINNANNAAPQSVTLNALNGTSNFYGNGGTGLFVQSFGLVTLNSVNADTNKVDGIHVDNATGALASQLKGVTILGYADVYNNPGYGLYIKSLGTISINTIDANNNNGIGVSIDNSLGNPGIGVTFTGNIVTSNSKNEGMDVYSRGPIAFNNLSDAWIGNNGSYGWNLDNHSAGSIGGITMTITVNQNIDFGNNGGYGLLAQSLGAITTNNLDANGNGGYGVTLDNAFPGAAATATITMNDPSTTDNNFSNNSGDGLDVLSNRAITLNTISANNNTGYGAYIDNCGYNSGTKTCTSTITPPPGVTLTGNNNFSGNGSLGLVTYSIGAITMNNVIANNNTGGGASLNTQGLSTPQSVTLTGSNYFIGNSGDGLDITANGAITINNLTAWWNGGNGAYLNNCLWNGTKCTGSGNITLTGINSFIYNNGDGLYAYTHGNITLNNVTADQNINRGVYGKADGSILVACGSMTNNGGYGWSFQASSGQTVTLHGVFAYGNNGNTNPAGGTFIYQRSCP